MVLVKEKYCITTMDKQYFEDLKFCATPDKEELAEIDKQLIIAEKSNNEHQMMLCFYEKVYWKIVEPVFSIYYYLIKTRPQIINIYEELECLKVVKNDYLLTASQIFDFLIDYEGAESLLKVCGFAVFSNLWQYIERKENKEEFIEKANNLHCEELALRCGYIKSILQINQIKAKERTDYYQMQFGSTVSQAIGDLEKSFVKFEKEPSLEDLNTLLYWSIDIWASLLNKNLSSYEKEIIQNIFVNEDSLCIELYKALLLGKKKIIATGNTDAINTQKVYMNVPLWDKIDVSEIQETDNKDNHLQNIDSQLNIKKSCSTNHNSGNAENVTVDKDYNEAVHRKPGASSASHISPFPKTPGRNASCWIINGTEATEQAWTGIIKTFWDRLIEEIEKKINFGDSKTQKRNKQYLAASFIYYSATAVGLAVEWDKAPQASYERTMKPIIDTFNWKTLKKYLLLLDCYDKKKASDEKVEKMGKDIKAFEYNRPGFRRQGDGSILVTDVKQEKNLKELEMEDFIRKNSDFLKPLLSSFDEFDSIIKKTMQCIDKCK